VGKHNDTRAADHDSRRVSRRDMFGMIVTAVAVAAASRRASGRLAPPSGVGDFRGLRAGDEREVAAVKLCWCPPGPFRMGSPLAEPDRHSDEDQVEVILTKGFWTGKYEVTQGQWQRVIGKLPGPLTGAGGEGDDFPVYNVNYAEAKRSVEGSPNWVARLGAYPSNGSSVCRLKRSGSMPVAQAQRRPPRSVTS
jgi:formylglycine-generating enzyme required for sulfatase activity